MWSEFSDRPKSLGIRSEAVRKSILEGGPTIKPPSIKRRFNRIKYNSPEKIDETFKTCYEFLESRASETYSRARECTNPLLQEELLTQAEINNPEVQYNFQFHKKLDNDPTIIDYEQPVYRHLGKKHWESYSQMLLMQRLETLSVIPDTLPTLVPKVEVNVKFPYSTGVNKWIEPGELLSSNATSLPPVFKIQEFEKVDTKEQLYTILVLNPDEPNVKMDSYNTSLCYGLANVKVSYNDNVVDPRRFNESNVIASYLPPVPEKNAGKQRFAVWVFRQKVAIAIKPLDRSDFNIREFAKQHALKPVGAHVWRSEWDFNVNSIRAKYGLPAARVFERVRI